MTQNHGQLCIVLQFFGTTKAILGLSSGQNDFPTTPVKYHRSCRSEFTQKRDLQAEKSAENNKNDPLSRGSSRDASQGQSAVLPDCCIFCNKTKYKPNTKTRGTMHSIQEFRADETVRICAQLHIKHCTNLSDIAERVIGVCAKDLTCSEAKYHASCYKGFVRIQYACDTGKVQCSSTDDHELQPAYDVVVCSYCEELILNPRVIEFTEIRKLLCDEADKLGIDVPQSHS